MATFIHPLLATTGRVLLGLYFILPGISKILGWDNTAALMAEKGIVLVPAFLALTIVLQIVGGLALALGFRTQLIAFVLAGLTLVISVVIHNFWALAPGELQTAHELQNFVKNLAIMAGLLGYAGLGEGPRTHGLPDATDAKIMAVSTDQPARSPFRKRLSPT